VSKQSLITHNPVWSNYAQGLQNPSYTASRIFPIIAVDEEDRAQKIPLVSRENFERSNSRRAPHGKTPVVNGNPVTGFAEFNADLDVLAYGIDITERKGKVIDMYKHGTMVVSEKILLNRELRVANLIRNAAAYTSGNTATPANKWDSTGNPLADIEAAKGVIEGNTGLSTGLKIHMSGKAWRAFKNNANVKAALSDSATKVVTLQVALDLLEVDEIIIGRTIYRDVQNNTNVDVWGKDVQIFGNAPVAGQRTLYSSAFGYNVAVKGFDRGPLIDTYSSEDGLVEYVRAWTYEDAMFHGANMGYLLTNVIT
jgi:hypothetical protein